MTEDSVLFNIRLKITKTTAPTLEAVKKSSTKLLSSKVFYNASELFSLIETLHGVTSRVRLAQW